MSVALSRNWPARNVLLARSRYIVASGHSKAGGGSNVAFRRGAANTSSSFVLKRSGTRATSAGKSSLSGIVFVMIGCLVFAGALYLYQVNNISIKGYEIKAIESRIQELEKENQKLKIREVESRSMYNIEKNTENLNLVNSTNVTYVEMKGPMAMK